MLFLFFLLFIVLYISIPGMFILSFDGHQHKGIEALLYSFFLGLGFLIIEYYLFSSVGLKCFLYSLNPIISVLFFFLKRQFLNHVLSSMSKKDRKSLLFIFALSLFLVFLTQKSILFDIHNVNAFSLYQDYVWHIGNISSLGKGFPFYDYNVSGIKFYYHFFTDLVFGIFKYIFKYPAYDIMLSCSPILTAYLFAIAMIAFMQKRSIHVIIGFFIFLCSGATLTSFIINTETADSLLNFHIFSNINGVAFSLASVVAVYLYFVKTYEKPTLNYKSILLLSILTSVMTGLKGPFAIVLVSSITATSLLNIIIDRKITIRILIPITIIASFVFVYIFIITGYDNLLAQSQNNRAITLSISGTFSRTCLGSVFNCFLNKGFMLKVVYCIIAIIIGNCIAVGPLFVLFFCHSLVSAKSFLNCIKKGTQIETGSCVSLFASWVGILGFWFLSHAGFSQVYFLFIAVLFIVGDCLQKVFNVHSKRIVKNRLTRAIVTINCIIWGIVYTSSLYNTYIGKTNHHGIIYESTNEIGPEAITQEELQGIEWLRDHSSSDSIIASDRIALATVNTNSSTDSRFFYYGAFSERQIFIEGFSYSNIPKEAVSQKIKTNRAIYNLALSEKTVRREGIDYIIVSKRFNQTNLSLIYNTVFENYDIIIYEVNY